MGSPETLLELDRGVNYVSIMHLKVLELWEQDINNEANDRYVQLLLLLLAVYTCLSVVYILGIRRIVGTLEENYCYYRDIYETYVPLQVVSELRSIKAKLVINKVLKQCYST